MDRKQANLLEQADLMEMSRRISSNIFNYLPHSLHLSAFLSKTERRSKLLKYPLEVKLPPCHTLCS